LAENRARARAWWGVLLSAPLALMGCADDPCADAFSKLQDCGVAGGRDLEDDACEEVAACTAECINDADCEDIATPTPDGAYTRCVNGC
jgi:hypothetical protein